MKSLPWVLVIMLLIACVTACFWPRKPLPAEIRTETKVKTVVRVDTLLICAPMAPLLIVRLTDTIATLTGKDEILLMKEYNEQLYDEMCAKEIEDKNAYNYMKTLIAFHISLLK